MIISIDLSITYVSNYLKIIPALELGKTNSYFKAQYVLIYHTVFN